MRKNCLQFQEIKETYDTEFVKKTSIWNPVKSLGYIKCYSLNIPRFTFVENTISNFLKLLTAQFLGCDGLFCFISICKFGCFRNPFATITSMSDLYFRLKLFCWYKQKKAAAKAAENHGDKWGLTWYLWWSIYTLTPTWTHSQNSLAATEAPNLKISSHGKRVHNLWFMIIARILIIFS